MLFLSYPLGNILLSKSPPCLSLTDDGVFPILPSVKNQSLLIDSMILIWQWHLVNLCPLFDSWSA